MAQMQLKAVRYLRSLFLVMQGVVQQTSQYTDRHIFQNDGELAEKYVDQSAGISQRTIRLYDTHMTTISLPVHLIIP